MLEQESNKKSKRTINMSLSSDDFLDVCRQAGLSSSKSDWVDKLISYTERAYPGPVNMKFHR